MMGRLPLVGPVERLLYLRSQPDFSWLGGEELVAMANLTRERFFRRGSHLCVGGKPVASVHLLVEGSLRVLRKTGTPRETEAPDTVGMLSVLAQIPGPQVEALTDVTTLELSADAFMGMLEEHGDFLMGSLGQLARRLVAARIESRFSNMGPSVQPAEFPQSAPLNMVDWLVYLRRIPAFSNANVDALAGVARCMEEIRLGPGETLWDESSPADFGVVVLSGRVACAHGSGTVGFSAGPGFGLGLIEALGGIPYSYSAVSETPVVGLRIATGAFLDVLDDQALLGRDLLAYMARHLIHLYAGYAIRT